MHVKTYVLLGLIELSLFAACSGNLIVLDGTGRAGKSGAQRALVNLCPDITFVDEDDMFFSEFPCVLQERFPEETAILRTSIRDVNMYHAIDRSQFHFEQDITDEQKKAVYDATNNIIHVWHNEDKSIFSAMQDHFYATVHNKKIAAVVALLDEGKAVVSDFFDINTMRERLEEQGHKIFSVMLFCSLKHVVDRQEKRNALALETGNIFQHRLYLNTLRGFKEKFELASDEETAVGTLSREEVDECFETVKRASRRIHESYCGQVDRFIKEINESELEELKQKFLDELLQGNDRVFLKLKKQYDYVIDTSAKSAEEVATLIRAYCFGSI